MQRKLLNLVILLLLLIPVGWAEGKEQYLAFDGVIDFQGWEATDGESIDLRGDWWAFDGILSEQDIRSGQYQTYRHNKCTVPGDIRECFDHTHTGKAATLLLRVKNISTAVALGMEVSNFTSTHQTVFWVPGLDNYQTAPTVGILSDKNHSFVPWSKRQIETLPYPVSGDLIIAMRIEWTPIDFGLPLTPTIGALEHLQRNFYLAGIKSAFILGIFALLFMNNIVLFIVRRKDRSSLLLAIFSALLFMRYFNTEGYTAHLIATPSSLFFFLSSFTLNIGSNFAPSIYGLFLSYVFNVRRIRSWNKVGLCLAWIPIFGYEFGLSTKIMLLFYLFYFALLVYNIVSCARHKVDEIGNFKFVTVGLLFLAFSFLNDVCVFMNIIGTPFVGHYGMLIFTFFQTIIVARNFARAHNTAERLSQDLLQEVDLQTEKLRLQRDKLEEQQKSLGKVHEELKESDEQKTRFFRSISHELRTPLTMILGSLQDSDEPERLKRSMSIASKHAKRLYRLVNQLLDFQKVALSKVKLRLDPVNLETFLTNLAEYVESSCQSQGLEFVFEINHKVQGGWTVHAQIDALEKILFNYIGNALKFTPKGGTITLSLNIQGHFARIAVRDTGCGIPKNQQDKLFKLFSQVEGPQQQARQGTGLGLALVKELVQKMEGRIGVESEDGQGAEFWVELPRIVADADRHAVLLVDPDVAVHQSLMKELDQFHLTPHFHAVTTLEDAELILKEWPVQALLVRTGFGGEAGSFLERAAASHPLAWRVIITNAQRNSDFKNISAQAVQGLFSWPLDPEFFLQLQTRLKFHNNRPEAPILDLVYVDDEANMRKTFLHAMQRFSLIERYRVVDSANSFRELLPNYRIKAVVIDANLEEAASGLTLLAQIARLSPETYRILFTGDNTNEVLTAALQNGHAQYIIYKPADFEKEFKVIEHAISQSPIQSLEDSSSEFETINRDWQLAGSLLTDTPTIPTHSDDPASDDRLATILIVDDLGDMRSILHDILHKHGYRVLHAASGEQALERARSKRETIDLIITDWMMPGMSGPDLIAELHQHDEFSAIPTIMLTAKSDESSRSEGMRMGASAYLSKPFDYLELISITENLLDLKKHERKIVELNRFINENVLQRFLPPTLVQNLVDGKAIFDDKARLHSITVIFADLVSFTSSTERLGPTRMARILNSFLVSMTDVIFNEGGTIDKFIGDAILVFFGAPEVIPVKEQIERATRCAMRMQEALEKLNEQWITEEQHSFQMRIGIHHGPAIVGSFGGQKRSDYTAIGHTVNLASRIEGLAEPGEILITDSVREFVTDDCWEFAGNFKMKGVEGETSLFRLKNPAVKSAA